MKTFYFTFGCTHPLRDFAQKVVTSDKDKAMACMLAFYGKKWSYCFGPYEFDGIDDHQTSVTLLGSIQFRLIPHTIYDKEVI